MITIYGVLLVCVCACAVIACFLSRKHDTDNNLKLDGLELLKAIAGMDGDNPHLSSVYPSIYSKLYFLNIHFGICHLVVYIDAITVSNRCTPLSITDDHHHEDEHEEGAENSEEQNPEPKETFKVDEIIPIVDSILEQDDKVNITLQIFSITI